MQKQSSRSFLCDKYKITDRVLTAHIEDIQDKGYQVVDDGNYLEINKVAGIQNNRLDERWNGDKLIRFALVSDTHLCSMAQQLTHLNTFYDICQKEGIEAVCTANAIKYLWRWKRKNGKQDLEKAQWYINRLIQRLEDQDKVR